MSNSPAFNTVSVIVIYYPNSCLITGNLSAIFFSSSLQLFYLC